jgi:hypothetical protein
MSFFSFWTTPATAAQMPVPKAEPMPTAEPTVSETLPSFVTTKTPLKTRAKAK